MENGTQLNGSQAAPAAGDPVLQYRLALKRNGYHPIPIKPGTKRPATEAWSSLHGVPDSEIAGWGIRFTSRAGTGLLLGHGVACIDVDIVEEAAAQSVWDIVCGMLEERGTVLKRVGRAPKHAVLVRTPVPFSKTARLLTAPTGERAAIEVLGAGQQVVVDGTHPETKQPYTWLNGVGPDVCPRDRLPELSQEDADALLDRAAHTLVTTLGYTIGHTSNGGGHPAAMPGLPSRMDYCIPGTRKLDVGRWLDLFDGDEMLANHLAPPAIRAMLLDGMPPGETAEVIVEAFVAKRPADWTREEEIRATRRRVTSCLKNLMSEHDWSDGTLPDWMPERDQAQCAEIIVAGGVPYYSCNGRDWFIRSSGRETPGKDKAAPQAKAKKQAPARPFILKPRGIIDPRAIPPRE
jgi:hypothetical protein